MKRLEVEGQTNGALGTEVVGKIGQRTFALAVYGKKSEARDVIKILRYLLGLEVKEDQK